MPAHVIFVSALYLWTLAEIYVNYVRDVYACLGTQLRNHVVILQRKDLILYRKTNYIYL